MIIDKLKRHKTIVSNTVFLSIIQLVNILVPLLALPYVIKTIGTDQYGLIAFAQSIVAFFIIFINFGLDISAVKDVSQNRGNKDRLSEIVSSVFSIKVILFLISGLLFVIVLLIVPRLRENYILFLIVFSSTIPEIIFPQWFFQGIERMAMITIVKLIAIVFYLSTLFFVVKNSSDFLFVPLLQIGGVFISSIIGFLLLTKVEKVKLRVPHANSIRTTFKDSMPFFMSRISFVVNSNIAQIISGFFLGMSDVAAFDLAKKIINFAFVPLQMLMQAVFPHNANKQNINFAKKFLYVIAIVAFCEVIVVGFLAPYIVNFFAGDSLPQAILIVRILCVYIVAGAFGNYFGSPVLVAFGYPKPFNRSVYLSTIALLLCYGIYYLFGLFTLTNFAIALVISEITIVSYRFYYCKKYKLL